MGGVAFHFAALEGPGMPGLVLSREAGANG